MKAKYSPTSNGIDHIAAPSELRVTLLQVLTGLGAAWQLIGPGMVLGFSAVALPQLRKETSFEPLTEEQCSWFASIASISTPVGCLISGWTLDRWGRRTSLILLNLPGIVGWALLALANGLVPLYAGRVLTGLALGMASATANVYLGEVTTPKLRGALMCWNSLSIALGILISYILGWLLPWYWAAACAEIPTVMALIATFFMPECAAWLLSKTRPEDAERALVKLRGGGGPLVKAEFEELIKSQEKRAKSSQDSGLRKLSSHLRKPQFWKPLLIMNLFFAFQQFAGIYVVIFYAVDMVDLLDAGKETVIDKYLATVLIGVARLIVTGAVSVAMRRCGRRSLALISGIGMTVCMFALVIYSMMFMDVPSVIPVVSLIGFIVTSTIGFMTLPWAMLGEMFPVELRGAGGGITTCCAYLLGFAVIKAYPGMVDSMEPYGVFSVYGVFCLLGTLFVGFFLPETAGRTLQEIEASFAGKKAQSPQRETQSLSEA